MTLVPHLIIDDSSTGVTKWVLLQGRGREGHSHPLARAALLYHVHKKAQPEYLPAVTAALANKGAYLTYRENERVLWGLNLELDRRAYYNLARLKAMPYDGDGLKALIACLEQDGWTHLSKSVGVQMLSGGPYVVSGIEQRHFLFLDPFP
jgi:hypothetical protein